MESTRCSRKSGACTSFTRCALINAAWRVFSASLVTDEESAAVDAGVAGAGGGPDWAIDAGPVIHRANTHPISWRRRFMEGDDSRPGRRDVNFRAMQPTAASGGGAKPTR